MKVILLLMLMLGAMTAVLPKLTVLPQEPNPVTTSLAFPKPKTVGDPALVGRNIGRAMALLTTSTPAKRNTVRVLFYGQSITEQKWWKTVADDLRRRFPNANLVIENRALGGFSSQLLVKTAETDLYSFYPDLVIFHVYGSHDKYEDIIRRIRERTTADILIQTDHVTNDSDLDEPNDASKIAGPDGKIWNSFMNYKHLPGLAAKYQTGLVDQRNLWKQYLRDHKIPAQSLLSDSVHLNAHGEFLMAEFAKGALVSQSRTAKITPLQNRAVRTWRVVDRGIYDLYTKWKEDKITLPFEGNRVDLIASPKFASNRGVAQIRIDGKKPSEFPELYAFTRALATPGGKWPAILKIGSQSRLQLEEWTMDVRRDPQNEKTYTFTLRGSKTGEDGSGRSDERFVSRSGRIVIEPDDWNVDYSLSVLAGVKPLPATFTVRWSVVPMFADTFAPKPASDASIENIVTAAQGLPPGPHTLEIVGSAASVPLTAIRVYRPALHGQAN